MRIFLKFHEISLPATVLYVCLLLVTHFSQAQSKFNVIAFYTAKNDQAHISYVQEANNWFASIAKQYQFTYASTKDWSNLNAAFLAQYQLHSSPLPTNGTDGPMTLRANPDIKVLLSIDPASFPLGTGPKQHEIWHSGDYPVVWTNKKYRMLYANMGHNDIDYEHGTNKTLSFTFVNPVQNQLIIDALLWLGKGSRNIKSTAQ